MSALVAPVGIPDSHRDLLTRPICGVLTTLQPDGQPHSALVWLDAEGDTIRVSTTLDRQSGRNLMRDSRASVLVVDPDDTSRFIQLRGDVELVRAGAARETRVIAVLHPIRVSVDAIHR
jgi:PPOX class probable F420-dependent enzyme